MKDKILLFIIGLLVGSIITASGFLIYQNTNQTASGEQMEIMERPDGNNTLPEMLNGGMPGGNSESSNVSHTGAT